MHRKSRAAMISILCLAALCCKVRSAGAQFVQYTPPGGPEEEAESRQERLARELQDARYHLGPLRIAPWATLRDIAYVRSVVDNGQETPNDLTATAGVGFRAYLRNGRKVTWIAQVLPEYTWWQRQTFRRVLNGRYLLGMAGYFNRLTVEVQAGRQQRLQIATPEAPVPVSTRSDSGQLLTELRITGAFSAFAGFNVNRQNNLIEGTVDPLTDRLRLLDRDEQVESAGLRWRPTALWTVGVGAEHSTVDFLHGELDRSNSGTAPMAQVRFQGGRLRFQTQVAARSLRATRGSEFIPFHGVTGDAALFLENRSHVGATVYGSRNLEYSIEPSYAYFLDERLGVAVNLSAGRRVSGRLFGERGSNDYATFAGVRPRRDDVSSWGGNLNFNLNAGFVLGLQAVRSRFDGNGAAPDRSYTSVGATVTLAGLP